MPETELLMATPKFYVIHSNSRIESLYTLYPLLVSKYSPLIGFINSDSDKARKVNGECVILVRTFKGNKRFKNEQEKKRALIQDFRTRFNRVIMLDDGAGSDSLHYEYMDLVDLYYKGKLLKDRSNYLKPMYGRQLFTNYYNEKFGIIDESVKLRDVPQDPGILKKLRVSWNLGCGVFPIPNTYGIRLAQAATHFSMAKALKPWFLHRHKNLLAALSYPPQYTDRVHNVQARFGGNNLPNTIGFQRKIFIDKCLHNKNVLTGSIKPKAYQTELKGIAAVLSPFGWGEVCFRDFEAVSNGSLLIKPDMDHIETWPDIYKKGITYIPVDWDGFNLVEVINDVCSDTTKYNNIIEAAQVVYKKALLETDQRILQFLEEASGTRIN